MGMPEIIGSNITRFQAITDILESVAYEEAAISHILNAEGEKLQKVVEDEDDYTTNILLTNTSIKKTINSVTLLELLLIKKLELFEDCICPPPEPCIPIQDVSIDVIPPDLGRTVTKISNEYFTITKQSATTLAGSCYITLIPDYPVTLTTAPTGVSLAGNTLTIDYAVVTEGEITLTAGIGECEIEILIEFFDV
ncbi:hypothetical protein [Anaerotignum sp.]|uniref:hypothetical protein n=1 Tax=Anaerotignum sp. TaxID=2039241 RepID=UPI0027146258|nr:hypothetical protein [Anaerotignum sp.]